MYQHTPLPESKRKVTLSCRVLPEQKLIIAERAKELEMSPSQYMEAKVLREDNFSQEKTIEEQRQEIENLKSKLLTQEEHLEKVKVFYKEKMNELKTQLQEQQTQALPQKDISFIVTFSEPKYLQTFKKQLQTLASKHGFDLPSVLKMCVRYTLKNDQSKFILERVSEFVKKNYSN